MTDSNIPNVDNIIPLQEQELSTPELTPVIEKPEHPLSDRWQEAVIAIMGECSVSNFSGLSQTNRKQVMAKLDKFKKEDDKAAEKDARKQSQLANYINAHPNKKNVSETGLDFINKLSNLTPNGFQYDDISGMVIHTELKYTNEGEKVVITPLCSPLAVTARTKSDDATKGGLVLEWLDLLDTPRKWVIPQSMIADDFKVIAKGLHENLIPFLTVESKAKTKFMEYLQLSRPEKWITYTEKTGWNNGSFVFPEMIIGGNSEDLIFQSSSSRHKKPKIVGTIDDWKSKISKYCEGNPTMTLGACTGFASALAGLLGHSGCLFHVIGDSSTGKTISLGVNMSVMGQTKGSWRGTDNAKESEFEARNHIGTTLDEMGQATPKDVYQITYMLGNGQGKARATQTGMAQSIRTFNLIALSNGELGIDDMVALAGNDLTGGLSVRCIQGKSDIFQYKCFDNIHEFETGEKFAKYMEKATSVDDDNYNPKASGVVGIEFIKYLAQNIGNNEANKDRVKNRIAEVAEEITPKGSDSQVRRMANSLSLVIVAGEEATRAGLTGWNSETPLKDISSWWDKCVIPTRGGITSKESQNASEKVKEFFELHHMSHFTPVEKGFQPQISSTNHYGYVETVNGITTYYVTAAGWKKICNCKNTAGINAQCAAMGWLQYETDKEDKRIYLKQKKLGNKNSRYYWVNGKIIADEEEIEKAD